MEGPREVFDRRLWAGRRARAAERRGDHELLVAEVAERLAERLDDVARRLPRALVLSCRQGLLAERLAGRGGIERLVQADLAPAMVRQVAPGPDHRLVADEEALPFAAGSFDLVLSFLGLHWVNDLPGALLQIRQCLKPDGLFLAALFAGETLGELREAWLLAESELEGGASPRVAPFAELRDLGGLLQRAGFALPVADLDEIPVSYPDALTLMADLRALGESNALAERRRRFTRRGTLLRAAEIYGERHGGPDGRLPARFQVAFLTGWAPHESQPKPLAPGSARSRLADALDSQEEGAGEPALPKPRQPN